MATSKAEMLAELLDLDMTKDHILYLGRMRISIPRAKTAAELLEDWQEHRIAGRPVLRIERCLTHQEEIERRKLLLIKKFNRAPAQAFKGLA